jgi:hypothetical protein
MCSGQIPLPDGGACTSPAGAGACAAGICVAAPPPPTQAEIQGILNARCVSCHNDDAAAAGLSWSDVRAVVSSGLTDADLGLECSDAPPVPIINPGNPDTSYVILKITPTVPTCLAGQTCTGAMCRNGARMPRPATAAPLTDDQIARFRQWIALGAPL